MASIAFEVQVECGALGVSDLEELVNATVGLYRGAYSMHRVLTDRGYSNPEIDQLLTAPSEDLLIHTVREGQSITIRASEGSLVPAITTASLLAAALTDCGVGVRDYYETLRAKGAVQNLSRLLPDMEKIDLRLASSPGNRANGNRYEHDLAWHFCDLELWRKRSNIERVTVRTFGR